MTITDQSNFSILSSTGPPLKDNEHQHNLIRISMTTTSLALLKVSTMSLKGNDFCGYLGCIGNLSSFPLGVWILVPTSFNENKRSYHLLDIYPVPLHVLWMSHHNLA